MSSDRSIGHGASGALLRADGHAAAVLLTQVRLQGEDSGVDVLPQIQS